MNTLKTFVLMLVMSALLLLAGFLTFGVTGVIVAAGIAMALNFFSYWNSDKIALRMAHARLINYEDDKDLHQLVEEQVQRAGIPMPKVYIIEDDSPNAFATGRNPANATIAVTTGIRRLLNREELGGVIAHELAHVGNRDTLIMTMVATMAMAIGFIAMAAQFAMWFGGFGRGRVGGGGGSSGMIVGLVGLLIVAIVLPLVATLVRMSISRAREFQADATGARTSGNPNALASALEKLEMGTSRKAMEVNNAIAHLYIVNPLKGKHTGDHQVSALGGGSGISGLFSTHPPIAERVRRLRDMRADW
ncbi:MAG: zinc metalloprotease HtpX [Dehalococcoidia bacterium]|nr:zinc metalloprotease HtpX [Dehalococcoidia bacterium]